MFLPRLQGRCFCPDCKGDVFAPTTRASTCFTATDGIAPTTRASKADGIVYLKGLSLLIISKKLILPDLSSFFSASSSPSSSSSPAPATFFKSYVNG